MESRSEHSCFARLCLDEPCPRIQRVSAGISRKMR
jgi:hypothetical protein